MSNIYAPKTLYLIGNTLEKCVLGSKAIVNLDVFEYCFRYSKIVDYSEKKFNCTQAQATKRLLEATLEQKPELRNELKLYLSSLKDLLNQIDIDEL